ncbi:hypothetical protein CcaverHIS002_0102510 [Cutaneotrichosporon cavernicola]|nr:hypothetical protein CcaverHIS002_0102510 [Cutaneotrichosporon cavernicola]
MPAKTRPRPRPSSATGPRDVADIMLSWLGLGLVSCTPLQTLWAGYGHIVSITARSPSSHETTRLVLKLISPPPGNDEGHLRKMLSYEVEQEFYTTIAPSLPQNVAVAHCLASTHDMAGRPGSENLHGVMAMLLTDLRPDFPIAGSKRGLLPPRAVYAALDWLARFHSHSARGVEDMESYLLPPLEEADRRKKGLGGSKLWLNGGYTYLATRRGELAELADSDSEWNTALCSPDKEIGRNVADAVAAVLTPRGRTSESVIHGDVKSENLFTTRAGDKVAFFDFQYVGLGLGVCDLAKLFTCSVPEEMLADSVPHLLGMQSGERGLLERYRATLIEKRGEGGYEWEEMVRHWETALVDWCRFQASWGFWGNTEWLEARVRHILADAGWRTWLKNELQYTK